MDFSFLVSRYDRELDRKDKLTAAVGLPVTILAALGGIIVAIARGFSYSEPWRIVAFMAVLAVDFASIGWSLYWLTRNYGGSEYVFIPKLEELEKTRVDLEHGEPSHQFMDALRESIILAADANAQTNDTRSAFMDRANQTLVVLLVATAATGVLYVVDQLVVPNTGP